MLRMCRLHGWMLQGVCFCCMRGMPGNSLVACDGTQSLIVDPEAGRMAGCAETTHALSEATCQALSEATLVGGIPALVGGI